MPGKTQITETGAEVTIALNADEGRMRLGSHGTQGNLNLTNKIGFWIFNADGPWLSLGASPQYAHAARPEGTDGCLRLYGNGRLRARLDAGGASLMLGDGANENARVIELDGAAGVVRVGEPRATVDGKPAVNGGPRAIELWGNNATVQIGRDDIPGTLEVKDGKGRTSIKLAAHNGSMTLGTTDRDGDLMLRDASNRETVHIDGAKAAMRLGALGVAASLTLQDAQDRDGLVYDGVAATLRVGTSGNGGRLLLRNAFGAGVFDADANQAQLTLGASGAGGRLLLRNASGAAVFDADAGLARLTLRDAEGRETIQLDGTSGDILLTQADCAEEFDFDVAAVTPGMVVVIGDDERLTPSTEAYDRRVAGVVSGAGCYRPAIVLDRRPGAARPAVAMIGKVECLVDAAYGPIRCGDLLVSSPTPGHAMAGRDAARTPGAVLGKALRGLQSGTGRIPILVCLQ